MVIIAVYRDSSEKEFSIKKIVGSSFRNEAGHRPIQFVIPAELPTRDKEYLKMYVHVNFDEKLETVIVKPNDSERSV